MALDPKKIVMLFLLLLVAGYSFSQTAKEKAGSNFSNSDSLSHKFPGLISSYGKINFPDIKQQLKKSLFDSVQFIKNMFPEFSKNTFKKPIQVLSADLAYSGFMDSSYMNPCNNYYVGNFLAASNWLVAGIPVSVSYQNQTWSDIAGENHNRVSLQYDRNNYVSRLNKMLSGKIDPTVLLQKITDPLLQIKQNAITALRSDLKQIDEKYHLLLGANISELGNLENLFGEDILSLRNKFLNPGYINTIKEKEERLGELQNLKNIGTAINKEEWDSLFNEINRMKAVQEMVSKIEEHKNKWKTSGLLQKLKEWDLLKNKNVSALVNDPSTITKLAKQYLNLSGIQKFFLKINKMNGGQNVFSSGSLSLNHFLSKGIATEFLNNNKYFVGLIGKQKDNTSLYDLPFVNNILSNNGIAKALQFGLGTNESAHSHVSLSTFQQSITPLNGLTLVNSLRQVLVTTFSNETLIGQKGSLTTELSRSATNYNHIDSGKNKTGMQKIFSGEDLFQNLAFAVKYEDEYPGINLHYQFHVNHTANGYNNPGNIFLNHGSTEIGINARKLFLKKKLQLSLRTDIREYKYNENLDNKWRNLYSVVDLKWKMRKGQYIGLRYTPNRMLQINNHDKFVVTSISRLAAEANLSKKIASVYYRNYVNFSYQKNSYQSGTAPILNESLIFSSYQSVTINKKIIYLNCNYSSSNNNSQFAYFNSSLVSEAGTSYLLFGKISGSSSVGYSSVKDWYQQIGIRQTLSGQLGSRFNIQLYLDARKNLKLYQPLLCGLVRAEISLQYSLKNK
jgi:hypothetical protein